jgi:hypothetical protein
MLSASLLVLVTLGQTPESKPDAAALVEKLGSARYAEREATKSLEALGGKALPALRAALKSKDAEVRARARAMINKIEGNLLVQETLVRLEFKDATVEEIVKSISKQTGFDVRIGGPGFGRMGTDLGTGRITLNEPKPVPFWQAIDRICEVGKLTSNSQYQGMRVPGVAQPDLVLSYQPNRLDRPSYNHGPFHLSLISITYQHMIFFQSSAPMGGPVLGGVPGAGGLAKKSGARPTIKPSPKGAQRASEAEKAGAALSRDVRFYLQMLVAPEPRMVFNGNGNVKLLEGVDELGQSLLTDASDDGRTLGRPGMAIGMMMDGPIGNLTIHLHRPETPGKIIKTLRGTVEASVTASRSNPLVIPLEGAAGKTFQNDERRAVVTSIDADAARAQGTIELKFDDLEELFPAEAVDGAERGGRSGMMGRGFRPGNANPAHAPIQIVSSNGQYLFYNTSVDRDSGRVTLRIMGMNPINEPKELRISSVVRATTKIPFEFHDLPMP